MKLCKCGAIVADRCERCYPIAHAKTTKQRGYGHDHRTASERYRAEHETCEMCVMLGEIPMKESAALHHIEKIADAPHLRMQESNWLATCGDHHEILEGDVSLGKRVKAWSVANYHKWHEERA